MMLQSQQNVKTFLTAELEASLVYVEGIYGIDVDRLKFMDIYQSPGQQFPSLSILPGSTSEFQLPGPGNSASFIRRFDNINIVVWHRGNRADSRSIEDNVTAYMDALDYLYNNKADMDMPRQYQFVRITGTDYTDLFSDPISKTTTRLLKGAVFSIELRPNY